MGWEPSSGQQEEDQVQEEVTEAAAQVMVNHVTATEAAEQVMVNHVTATEAAAQVMVNHVTATEAAAQVMVKPQVTATEATA